jgi:hypothetical protein
MKDNKRKLIKRISAYGIVALLLTSTAIIAYPEIKEKIEIDQAKKPIQYERNRWFA